MANTPFEDRLKQSGVLPQTTGAPVAQPTGGGPIASKFQQQGYLPQAPAPEVQPEGPGVADYLSVGIRGLAEAVPATAAGIASAIQGQAGVEAPGQEDIIEKGIRAESRRLTEFEQEVARKYPESTAIQTLSRLPRQLGFSLPSTAAGIAAGAVAAPAATVPGGQAVPFVAGGATAGAVAYRSASADIMRSYIDTLDEQKRSELGRGLTREETEAAKTSFESKATEYGLWEALPEAAGGALAGRLVFGPLKKMVGEKLAGTMLGKLGSAAGVVAEELGTETITQIGQSRTLAGTPLSEAQVLDWTPSSILEAAKQVAPDTLLMTAVLGGGASAGGALYRRRQETKLANQLDIDRPVLKERVQALLAAKQQNPEIDLGSEDAMRFLAGSVVLSEEGFAPRAVEEAPAAPELSEAVPPKVAEEAPAAPEPPEAVPPKVAEEAPAAPEPPEAVPPKVAEEAPAITVPKSEEKATQFQVFRQNKPALDAIADKVFRTGEESLTDIEKGLREEYKTYVDNKAKQIAARPQEPAGGAYAAEKEKDQRGRRPEYRGIDEGIPQEGIDRIVPSEVGEGRAEAGGGYRYGDQVRAQAEAEKITAEGERAYDLSTLPGPGREARPAVQALQREVAEVVPTRTQAEVVKTAVDAGTKKKPVTAWRVTDEAAGFKQHVIVENPAGPKSKRYQIVKEDGTVTKPSETLIARYERAKAAGQIQQVSTVEPTFKRALGEDVKYLNADLPLGKQSKEVQAAIKGAKTGSQIIDAASSRWDTKSGASFMATVSAGMQGDKSAAQYLRSIGVAGIKQGEQYTEFAETPRLDVLREGISSYLGTTVGEDAYQEGVNPNPETFDKLGKLLGKNIQFFTPGRNAPMKFAGVTGVATDTIFVNSESASPHMAVVGHEFLHEFKRDSAAEYAALQPVLREVIPAARFTQLKKSLDEALAAEGKPAAQQNMVEEEAIADYFGEQFTSNEFWSKVERRLGTRFQNFAQNFIDFIERVKGAFSGKQARDMEKARSVAAKALAKYVKARPQAEFKPGFLTFQREIDQQVSELDSAPRETMKKNVDLLKAAMDPKSVARQHLERILKVVPLQVVVDTASTKVPQAKDFARLIRLERQTRDDIIDTAGVHRNAAVELAKKGVGVEALHDVMSKGSFYQMYPWLDMLEQEWVTEAPIGAAEAKTTENLLKAAEKSWKQAKMDEATGKTFVAAYKESKAAYDTLDSDELKEAYIRLYEDISEVRAREKTALQALVEQSTPEDSDLRTQMVERLETAFTGVKGAYMPLRRDGDFTLEYLNEDGNRVFETFETVRERELAKQGIDALGGRIISEGVSDKVPTALAKIPREFVAQIQTAVEKQYTEGIDPTDVQAIAAAREAASELTNEVNQIFLRWAPETSALKNSMRRKNVLGYSMDMTRGYLGYMRAHAANIAYFEQGRKIDTTLSDVQKDISRRRKDAAEEGKTVDLTVEGQILNDLRARHASMKTVRVGKLASFLGRASTLWYLSSPSIALVQMSQLGLLTYPKLAVKFGPTKALETLTQSIGKTLSPKYGRSALFDAEKGPIKALAAFSKLQATVNQENRNQREARGKELGDPLYSRDQLSKEIDGLSEYEQEILALRDAMARGILDISLTHEVYQLAEGRNPNSTPAKVAKAMMIFMKHSELASRKAATLASYKLARERGLDFFDAMNYVTEVSDDTLFDFSPEAKGVALQGGAVRVLMAFQHFRIMSTFRLGMLTYNAVKGESVEVRKAAAKEFTGIMGMTALLAGVSGLPIGWLWPLLDGIFGDEDEPFDSQLAFRNVLEETAGKTIARGVTGGVPSMLGVAVSRRIGLQNVGWTDLNPPEYLHGDGLAAWLAQQALGPAYSIPSGFFRGYNQAINEGEYMRGLESVLPKLFKDPIKALRVGTEGVKTGAGKRLIEGDLDTAQILMMGLGFNPQEVFETSEKEYQLKNIGTQISARRGQLIQDFVKAAINNEDTTSEMAAIQKFNKAMPAFGIAAQDIRPVFLRLKKGDLMIEGRREMMVREMYGK